MGGSVTSQGSAAPALNDEDVSIRPRLSRTHRHTNTAVGHDEDFIGPFIRVSQFLSLPTVRGRLVVGVLAEGGSRGNKPGHRLRIQADR